MASVLPETSRMRNFPGELLAFRRFGEVERLLLLVSGSLNLAALVLGFDNLTWSVDIWMFSIVLRSSQSVR